MQIGSEDEKKIVGITEVQNLRGLNQKELIDLAASQSGDHLTVQLLNGLLIADEIHLLSAAQNAINAQNGNYMLSRSLDVEIIVFASTQRQIGRALDTLGVYDGLEEIAVVIVGPDVASVERTILFLVERVGDEIIPPFPDTRERIKRIKDHYQISDKEIDAISEADDVESRMIALSRCLASRVALVALET
ncbi:MAG: KEOPS complex subunit Cgi121 [Candidatus Thorarchaeota archaeon]